MAKIITLNTGRTKSGEVFTDEVINVTATVGVGGVNLQQDVIVVQALLRFALEDVGGFQDVQIPEPTGGDVRTTAEIIKKFQRYYNRTKRDPISIDGRIDPIQGKTPFAYGTNKLWTLYALHQRAIETSLLSGKGDPIKAICRRWSAVKAVLENSVGSLDLALE
jgi:hypothetical protein